MPTARSCIALVCAPGAADSEEWCAALRRELPDDDVVQIDGPAGTGVTADCAVVANPPPGVLATIRGLRFVQSLWAGVDRLISDPTLPAVPIARLVDPAMTRSMTTSVVAHTTALHLRLPQYRRQQAERRWAPQPQPAPGETTVLVAGMGELGTAAARALAALGFSVLGWSRSAKRIDGVEVCTGQLRQHIVRAQIIVNLLPLTPGTQRIFDRKLLGAEAAGVSFVNLGRGGHVDLPALLELLDSGHVDHAVLDVLDTEPPAADSPLWTHPSVTITPHVAATTSIVSASAIAARNIRRFRTTGTAEHLVDRGRGY
jgi:glyoxylate/hydroxypyruvate reductase